jgi:sigma-54 dependent transcriptional regulator
MSARSPVDQRDDRDAVFEDASSRELLRRLRQLAASEVTVLVTGETGTGKEVIARQLHAESARAAGPFVAVNCGALADGLLDSEFFGHERGAFTGAVAAREGWFEAANGGTVFLDEVAELSLSAQVKLLRVLQEREVVRVGSRQPRAIDVRLVAATNVDLLGAVAAGRFREDLYYRLKVATLTVRPLRERPQDLLRLANRFLAQLKRSEGKAVALTADAVDALLAHSWPGNVRELENALLQAALCAVDGHLHASDLGFAAALAPRPGPAVEPLETAFIELFEANRPNLLAQVEEKLVRSAYAYCHQNQVQTARLLGVSRNVVRARLQHYGLLEVTRAPEPEAPRPLPRLVKWG